MPHTRVCVRVRPGGPDSKGGIPPTGTCSSTPGQYEVDSIIDAATSSSSELFTCVCQHAVAELVEGKNSCVLVFGAPSTGKSFALEGPQLTGAAGQAAGIVPKAANAIFGHLQPVPRDKYCLQATLSGLTSRQDACVVDLLDPQAASITLREYSIEVATSHLTVMTLDSMDDVQQYLRRKAAPTALATPHSADPNSGLSKRAINQLGPMHVMYSFHLITRPGEPDEQVSTLTFVELIGQESRDAYGLRSPRNDEALQRQLSRTYAALTSVLLALRSAHRTPHGASALDSQPCPPSCLSPGLVPWRDSALTKWLQPVLATAAVLVILATVSPNLEDVQDTMATLSYVSRLRSSAVSVPSALLTSPAVGTPGKTVTVSPSWASRFYNIAPVGSTLNPSNLKLGGSFGSGGGRARAVGTPYAGRPGVGQAWGKQCLSQRPQSNGAGWDRSLVHGKHHMHGHGHRSASATPRIHSNTLENSAPLMSAFSAPADEMSNYLQSPMAAQQDGSNSLGQNITTGKEDGNHLTPQISGSSVEEQHHRAETGMSSMNVCRQSDALSSTVSMLRIRTGKKCNPDSVPALGAAGIHHGAIQPGASLPWNSSHAVSGHQHLGPDHHHGLSASDGATRAVAFHFREENETGLAHRRSVSPNRGQGADLSTQDADNRIYEELQATLRKRGVGVRAEALLDQLVQSLCAVRVQAEDAKSFRLRASQQQQALEAQVIDARQDRAAAVAVIEGLQRELREARSECATLSDQRLYFEQRALAASGTSNTNSPLDNRCSAEEAAPDRHHHGDFRQAGEIVATDHLRNGAGDTAALDVGPGWVPVQEVLDARAQASDARAEAFQAQQHSQKTVEGYRKGLQQFREQVHALAAKVAVQVPLDTNVASIGSGESFVTDATTLATALGQVQCEVERLQNAESAAQKLASDLQATSISAAVAKAQSTANSAAAEVAVERTKARELSAVVAELREQLESEQKRYATADAAAKAAEQRAEALAAHSQSLEVAVQRLEAAATAAADRISVERSAQEEIHLKEMSEQKNRATSAAARLDALQDDLAATQDQVSELHALNEALARDLSAKSQALEDSEASLQDAGSRCAAAEQQLGCMTALVDELQQELAHVREADRVHSMDAAQHAEAATQLRCQRDSLQERLASVQGTLGSTVAEADNLRAEVAARDTMLNHAWPLITTARKVLSSNPAGVHGHEGQVSDAPPPDVNWGGAGQVEMLLGATREAMSAVQSAAAELVASADARGAVGVLRKAQEDASAKEESLQGELERCRTQLANARASQDRAEQVLSEREQELKQLSEHLSSSETSAMELSKAHAAADSGRVAAEKTAAEANDTANALQAELSQCRHILQARDMQVQHLASQFQEASHRLSVCEGEMAQMIAQLELSGGKVANAEAAAQEARLRVQQLESAAATAQETVERMQRANQDLIQTHSEKERAAAVEESRLQADIEQLRSEAAAATRHIQSLEDRANTGDDAVVELRTLREEVAAATASRTETERRLKESECKLQCARDEMEMMQDKVRQAQEESREATAAADRMQKELAAAAATRRAIDASFERLDKARERTHSALSASGPLSRADHTAPGLQQSSAAVRMLGHAGREASPLSARSGLCTPVGTARALSLGAVRARGHSGEDGRTGMDAGNHGGLHQGPQVQACAGALSQELSRRESGWRERVVGRGEARLSLQGRPKGASEDRAAGFKQSSTPGAVSGQQGMSFVERLSASVHKS